jgi:hypothetical protein
MALLLYSRASHTPRRFSKAGTQTLPSYRAFLI